MMEVGTKELLESLPSHGQRRKESYQGFSGSSAGKESTCNAGDPGSIPGSIQIDALETGEATHYSICGLL